MFRVNLADISNLKRSVDLFSFNHSNGPRMPTIIKEQMIEDQKILFELSYGFSYAKNRDAITFGCGETMKPRVIKQRIPNWVIQNVNPKTDNQLRLIKSLLLTELFFILNPFRVNEKITGETLLVSSAFKDDKSNKYWMQLAELFAVFNAQGEQPVYIETLGKVVR